MPRVAVIGTGTMGTAMALRLLAHGLEVDVWSRHAASTRPLVVAGAAAHEDLPGTVKDADVAISMLPTAEITTSVMIGENALRGMRANSTWVQMATIGAEATEQLATESLARRPDVTFVDAPVSGSRGPAENGQLLILASGPPQAESVLEPVFSVLGRATLWLGPAGAGSRMKLVLNTWLAFQVEAAAEVAALAARLDVPASGLEDALPRQSPCLALCPEQARKDVGAGRPCGFLARPRPQGSGPGDLRSGRQCCTTCRGDRRALAGTCERRMERPRRDAARHGLGGDARARQATPGSKSAAEGRTSTSPGPSGSRAS